MALLLAAIPDLACIPSLANHDINRGSGNTASVPADRLSCHDRLCRRIDFHSHLVNPKLSLFSSVPPAFRGTKNPKKIKKSK
jgi:hypothetical protein